MNCFSISEPNGISLCNKQEYLDKLLDQFGGPKKDNQGQNHGPRVVKVKTQVEYYVLKDVLEKTEQHNMNQFIR